MLLRLVPLLAALISTAVGQPDDDESATSPWSGSISVRALSRLTQYGLDTAPERVTFVAGGTIAHAAGFSLALNTAVQPSPWSHQRTSLSGSYEIPLDDVWSATATLTRSWYPAASTNPLAASPTSATIGLAYDDEVWSFGADVDRYFGGDGATYASLDASVFLSAGSLSVMPMVSASFGSQSVSGASIKRGRGRNVSAVSSATTVTGLSSVDGMVLLLVPLGSGWSASAMPGVIVTPSDLASTSTRFTWSVGVRRSL